MSEKRIIRIIHILTGFLVFLVGSMVVFGLAYLGVSKLHDKLQNEQAQEQKSDDEDEKVVEEISSEGKLISIYNGANIRGLAGRWSEKLMEDGYRIEIIDNYSEIIENGIILVKEEGMGLDLQREYFPDAKIEVGEPDDDMDIQIILGKSEDDES